MDVNSLKPIFDTMAFSASIGEHGAFNEALTSFLKLCLDEGCESVIRGLLDSREFESHFDRLRSLLGERAVSVLFEVDSYFNDDGGYTTSVCALEVTYDDGFRFRTGYEDIPSEAELLEMLADDDQPDVDLQGFFAHGGDTGGICISDLCESCTFFYDRHGANSVALR